MAHKDGLMLAEVADAKSKVHHMHVGYIMLMENIW